MALDLGGGTGSETLPSLMLDRVALPQTDPMCKLGVILDSQLLPDEQVAVVARKPLYSFVCVPVASVSGSAGPGGDLIP